jgi:hypothetical protein
MIKILKKKNYGEGEDVRVHIIIMVEMIVR